MTNGILPLPPESPEHKLPESTQEATVEYNSGEPENISVGTREQAINLIGFDQGIEIGDDVSGNIKMRTSSEAMQGNIEAQDIVKRIAQKKANKEPVDEEAEWAKWNEKYTNKGPYQEHYQKSYQDID